MSTDSSIKKLEKNITRLKNLNEIKDQKIVLREKELVEMRTVAEDTGRQLGETIHIQLMKINKLQLQVDTLIQVLGKTTV